MTDEEAQTVTVEDFAEMELEKKLTMNRQTGYFQMIDIMINKIR